MTDGRYGGHNESYTTGHAANGVILFCFSSASDSIEDFLETVLLPCRVPWNISPSMSGVTLTHCETDVEPECSVVFGGGRICDDLKFDSRVIELSFKLCYFARTGHHRDSETIAAIGYKFDESFDGAGEFNYKQYLEQWKTTGFNPHSGFYVARESAWLISLPERFLQGSRHYVIDGRDGYVELIAAGYSWREWLWTNCHRDEAKTGPAVAEGEGVA